MSATTLAPLSGVHHVTAIANHPQKNIDFYTRVLGLRLVKLTVNFDDPGTYHLYYGNESGEPGTVLTFFPWAGAKPGVQGTGAVTATAFTIPRESVGFWEGRLRDAGLSTTLRERLGERVIAFEDHDTMRLELVTSAEAPGVQPWRGSDVREEHAIRGFHGVTLSVERAAPTLGFLQGVLGFRLGASEGARTRLLAGSPTRVGAVVDVLEAPELPASQLGAGVVHHVAFRVPDEATHLRWQGAVADAGMRVTPVMDRSYFRSIYFREPGHVLYELATDVPGFASDESLETLGTALRVPPAYQSRATTLQSVLPRITLPGGQVVGSR